MNKPSESDQNLEKLILYLGTVELSRIVSGWKNLPAPKQNSAIAEFEERFGIRRQQVEDWLKEHPL